VTLLLLLPSLMLVLVLVLVVKACGSPCDIAKR
jgi:hypothetical protein